MTIAYHVDNSLYLNITNRCSCACTFCIRRGQDGVGDGDNLWLEREPAAAEVIDAISDPSGFDEIVFCGYGEPTEALDVLLEVGRYLKANYPSIPVRINTNGLSDLLHGRETAPLLTGVVDEVSISLNAPDAALYAAVTRPRFGGESFDSMLHFAAACKQNGIGVQFTVVDVLEPADIARCHQLAADMGIPLRVRHMIQAEKVRA